MSFIGQICGSNSLLVDKFQSILTVLTSVVLKLFRIFNQRRSHPEVQCINLYSLTSKEGR